MTITAKDEEIERCGFDLGQMTIRCRHLLDCFDRRNELTREDMILIDAIRQALNNKEQG